MAGIDRRTGRPLDGFDHVRQSVEVIFSTPLGSRVMRRTFGSVLASLLGENMTSETLIRATTAVAIALALWEPRYVIRRVAVRRQVNTPERMRSGALQIVLLGEYRPRAHLGDPTPAGDRELVIGA